MTWQAALLLEEEGEDEERRRSIKNERKEVGIHGFKSNKNMKKGEKPFC